MIRSMLLAVGLFAHLSAAETLLVPEQYPTIQSAVNSASSGDLISVASGHEEGMILGSIQVTIAGRESEAVTIDAQGLSGCVGFPGTFVSFENVIFKNASDSHGAAGTCSSASFENCKFVDCVNSGFGGGAIGSTGNTGQTGDFYFTNCEFINCTGDRGGALSDANDPRNFFVDNCTFLQCHAQQNGGAICGFKGNISVQNSTFTSCSGETGGAIYHSELVGKTLIENCSFEQCSALAGAGGALKLTYGNSAPSEMIIRSCTFKENTASDGIGGGVYIFASSSAGFYGVVDSCVFEENSSGNVAGGLFCSYTVVSDSTFSRNRSKNDFGGGIYCEQSVVNTSTFTQNIAADGGGIFGEVSQSSSVAGCTFDGNSAINGTGGAIGGNILFTNSTLCNNYPSPVSDSASDGGLNNYKCVIQGSCCIGVTCIPSDENECLEAGGIFSESDCALADCGSPEGACCLSTQCAPLTLESCFNLGGSFAGPGTVCSETQCTFACEGDVSGNGTVDFTDLLILINNWGNCPT